MTRIGLLSDTHAWWDDRFAVYFSQCDEIWHAGDMVDASICDRLASNGKLIRAVSGNADGTDVRLRYPKDLHFEIEGVSVWMTHIGGYPGKYNKSIASRLYSNPPKLFVCGHSHICKVVYDHALNMLVMNPGAAGTYGQQVKRTLLRFVIDKGEIKDLECIELS